MLREFEHGEDITRKRKGIMIVWRIVSRCEGDRL
jgi:hypothetical protein